jgi:hypothetical protein
LVQDEVERRLENGKFDDWLQHCADEGKKILVNWAIAPRNDDNFSDDLLVLEVDEKFILVEFDDGEVFWVQKELISTTGFSG